MSPAVLTERRLTFKSASLLEKLQKSQSSTDEMIAILDTFDEQLSSLEASMRPTQVRTHALTRAHANIDKTLQVAEGMLGQFDVGRQMEPKIVEGPRGDYPSYCTAVDKVQGAVDFFTTNRNFKSSDEALKYSQSLLAKAMARLEEEFRQLLATHSKPQDPKRLFELISERAKQTGTPAPGGSGPSPAVPSEDLQLIPAPVVAHLHAMALRMLSSTHTRECLKVYRDIRGATLEQNLRQLGMEKLSREDVQKMPWEPLEKKIGYWIQYMNIAVRLLLISERKLCDEVYHRLDPHRLGVFAEVTEASMAMLLSFGDAVAKSKRAHEKLFRLLDMFETLRDLVPEIETIFESSGRNPETDPCMMIRDAAHGLLKRLGVAARETFAEFEEIVEKDVSKHNVADGTVHPLTSYVVNYLKYLTEYQGSLRHLHSEHESGDKQSSSLAVATMRILMVLVNNLDGKSKQYKDPALTQLFMMNNVHYIVRYIRKSDVVELLGDDWVQRHRRIVQQHATAYQRASWGKVTQCLSGQGLGEQGGSTNRSAIKERFKAFNNAFEALYSTQTQWSIPEQELRDAVRLQIAEVLLPAYRSFLRRYGSILEQGKNPTKYIKYQPEDLERLLGDFFEAKAKPVR